MSLLYNQLRDLILNNQVNDVQKFFQYHPFYKIDINLIYLAIERKQVEIIKLLISRGNINSKDENSLNKSSANNILCNLLENGIYIDSKIYQDFGYIGEAVTKILDKCSPIVVNNPISRKLAGDDDNNEDDDDDIDGSVLSQSIRLFGHQMVDVLLKDGDDSNVLIDDKPTALHFAAELFENPESFIRLLKYYNDPYELDSDNSCPLYLAVMKQNLITTEILLNMHTNINDPKNKMAFCLAILSHNDDEPKTKQLVNLFTARGYSIVHADFTDLSIPQPWLQHLTDIQNDREYQDLPYLLHREQSLELLFEFFVIKATIIQDFFNIFNGLMGPHVNVDIHFPRHGSLLHIACEYGRDKIVDYLLKRGADVNCRNFQYMRPIHYAVRGNYPKIVEQLLSARANIEYRNSIGESPFFMIFSCSSFDCLHLLLDAGSDVNCHDYLQRYPLHLAVEFEHETHVKLLLKYQADVNVRDSNNETPLDIILQRRRKRNFRIAKILLNHGAFYEIQQQQRIELNEFYDHLLMQKIKTDLIGWGSIVGNLDQNTRLADMNIFHKNCHDELERMKMIKLIKDITIYDVLTENCDKVAAFIKERNFLDQYKRIDFKIFPIYEDLLEIRFAKGMRKHDINSLASYCIDVLFNNNMPATVRTVVFNGMSDLELRRFIIVSPICKLRKLTIMESGNNALDITPEQHVSYLH
ncbi:serine/threonine-protein phosphatase 6 regulatory ankyrin repeat subunit C-like [Leptopilina heterotoma]|uniref:serine/threonine-protein phosphatase 6 regulatory ankyrin repeat subunit C-like n=1 Tax=Leptopilina heterotoma TaxID=63436 RepID=UPI001CA91E5C|nr:serine/threonine-protein phosphatase 6 regulatory ankyrin repeat subunit C-like [Leptopilina heterotoma]